MMGSGLTFDEWWEVSSQLSERGIDAGPHCIVSNEAELSETVRLLHRQRQDEGGGVYVGVGPEQNFSYIAAVRSELALILDICPANKWLHIMYKALFDMASTRSEFLSMLFGTETCGEDDKASAKALLEAQKLLRPLSGEARRQRGKWMREYLQDVFGAYMTVPEIGRVFGMLETFWRHGSEIQMTTGWPTQGAYARPSYGDVMTRPDQAGNVSSYLATERSFCYVRDLSRYNGIVPIVCNLCRRTALGPIGDALRKRDLRVSTMYTSNLEPFMRSQGGWITFVGNVRLLPWKDDGVVITLGRRMPIIRHDKLSLVQMDG